MLNLELANTLFKDREREVAERVRTHTFREALANRYESAFVDRGVSMSGPRPGVRFRGGSMEVVARPR
jgi:hypothetical protein